MPIVVACPCGKLYRVPDAGAGKRIQCKTCGAILDVPSGATASTTANRQAPTPSTRTCPYCAEPIAREARKCKHCGEYLGATLRQSRPPSVHVHTHGRRWSPGVAAVLSLFLPGVGQIYKGEVVLGLCWLLFVPLGYLCFFLPGLVLHLACVITAGMGNPDR